MQCVDDPVAFVAHDRQIVQRIVVHDVERSVPESISEIEVCVVLDHELLGRHRHVSPRCVGEFDRCVDERFDRVAALGGVARFARAGEHRDRVSAPLERPCEDIGVPFEATRMRL